MQGYRLHGQTDDRMHQNKLMAAGLHSQPLMIAMLATTVVPVPD
jgi:hypothetical protein